MTQPNVCRWRLRVALSMFLFPASSTAQTTVADNNCWPSENLTFPAGAQNYVARKAADFLIKAEAVPMHRSRPRDARCRQFLKALRSKRSKCGFMGYHFLDCNINKNLGGCPTVWKSSHLGAFLLLIAIESQDGGR